ncbi:MAG TPA: type II secretion system F family protein [Gemmatimonadaceae bacterium]
MFPLILAGVFFGTLLVIVSAYAFVNRRHLAAAEVLRDRLSATAMDAGPVRILKEERASQVQLLNRVLDGKSVTTALAREIERAGSRSTVGAFVLLTALCTVVGFLVGHLANTVTGILLAVFGAAAPFVNLRRLQHRRIHAFEAQLPEAIDMLVNALRAGYSLQAAMKFIGEEIAAPLGPEFARFYDEQRLGIDVRRALLNLQERVDTLDLKMFVTALLIQRETGGNLTEVMTNLATLIRERAGLRGQIETLTAEPKLSAVILSLLPVALFVYLLALNRAYLTPMFTTPIGELMLIYACVSVVVGYIVLRRLGNIDI